jgi:cell division protein FtsW
MCADALGLEPGCVMGPSIEARNDRTSADAPALADRGRVDATILIGIAAALMTIGLLMTFSASATLAQTVPARRFWASPTIRQLIFILGGLIVMIAVSHVPYGIWRWRRGRLMQPSIVLFLATLVLLAMVFMPGIGIVRNGARRWLQFGPSQYGIGFQPSEVAKLSMVILLSAWFSSRRWGPPLAMRFWTGMLPACTVIAITAAAVGIEDFGTGALLAGIGGMIYLAAGARLGDVALLTIPGSIGLWHMLASKPYRLERLTMFTRIWDDPLGKGYQQVQSLCAIASGGWWGRGLGQGIQKYGYLPESRTDCIFAVICEELGLPGALVVIGLFLALLWQGRRVMLNCPDAFGRFLALGITLTLVFQAAINIAVVTVSVPNKGIALPFVSAGGSGVLFLSAMVGVLANVARGSPPGDELVREIKKRGGSRKP